MARVERVVCRDLDELSRKAAEEFVGLARARVAAAGRFAVALSGGSTPRALYALLASAEFQARIPWAQIHFFWGDERAVPPDHPDSNYRMAYETLLAKVPAPPENIHRIETELGAEIAAARYEQTLRDFFSLGDGELPRFDLILLGLGDDGHTASLFPGAAAPGETRRLAAAVYVEKLKSRRVTLTLPVLNHAANIFFLVSGAGKAAMLARVLQGKPGAETLPARRIAPSDGRLVWFIDRDAAANLAD